MALKVYLLRHGETDYNKNKDTLEGRQEEQISLNDLGIVQSERLAKRLKDIKFKKIFSSPLNRAIQTANKLSDLSDEKIIVDERLKEYEPGEISPSSEKWTEKYNEMLASGMSKYNIRPFGGDNIWDLIKRVSSFLESIQKENGIIAVVAHSGVNSAFINLSQKKEKDEFLQNKQNNTCINILKFSNGKWKIETINDSNHITNMLPKKEIYLNQKEIKEIAIKEVLNKLADISEKIYIEGDLISEKFGSYDRFYERNKGSTINVYIKSKPNFEIPKKWKIASLLNGIKKYELKGFSIDGTKHKIVLDLIKSDKDIKGIKLEEINLI